jgi:Zn-dependent protease with chaperone function
MNTLKIIILLASLSGLLMAVGYFVAGGKGVVIALIMSVLMNFGSYWFSDSIVLGMYNAQAVTRVEAPVLYPYRKFTSFRKRRPTHSQQEEMKIMRLSLLPQAY